MNLVRHRAGFTYFLAHESEEGRVSRDLAQRFPGLPATVVERHEGLILIRVGHPSGNVAAESAAGDRLAIVGLRLLGAEP